MASNIESIHPNTMEEFRQTSQLSGGSGEYLDLLYEKYLEAPTSVPDSWRNYFDGLTKSSQKQNIMDDIGHQSIKEYFIRLAKNGGARSDFALDTNATNLQATANLSTNQINSKDILHFHKQDAINKLIVAYRRFGHRHANLDPLGLTPKEDMPILELDYYGFTEADLDLEFMAEGIVSGGVAKLRDIITILKNIYCNHIGYQYQYITDYDELTWLQDRIESRLVNTDGTIDFSPDVKKNILQQLTAAEGLERYLGTKYVGQKRFSLEGGESLIVIMDELIQRSGANGFKEIVVAMAHRGRLNVLVNILGKSPAELFAEFEGKKKVTHEMSGDVKYHQGFSSDLSTSGGNIHIALAFNPSHLEIVSPVAQGSVKARQDRRSDINKNEALLVSIHGDSAFSGQGVVMETMNMSQLRGFSIGGTVHIVVNNQVGFTTSDTRDTRSTRYCTDIAKMIEAPVFHVNGDDPQAVLWITQLALDYKHKFKKDVVIDLVCYRRHGHNEADEPAATQPIMYKVIKDLVPTREMYAKQLIAQNVITEKQDQDFVELYRNKLDQGEIVVAHLIDNNQTPGKTDWVSYTANIANIAKKDVNVDTRFDQNKLIELGNKLNELPEGFVLQAQVKKIIDTRAKMVNGEQPLDWGCAEILSYASLIDQGYSLRLCGQDSGRGTFAHRHAVLHDQLAGKTYCPLQSLTTKNARCNVIDSFLSEEAVLAFEYGYSTNDPRTLTIWEAQFGDFVNGAQVVIDQFMSSCEQKWGRLSGLVLLLPHGYEGMGPEHSSARLERFLQLCAEHNMKVCIPTTPSQLFHMFRRQMLTDDRKPLIVMSPKGFLRHKLAISSLDQLANDNFELIIPDNLNNIDNVTRVVLCSGKVFYDLFEERNDKTNVAIIRIEQLYPFPEQQLTDLLATYKNAKEVIWCQEEPKNQGAWYCTSHHFYNCLSSWQKLKYVGRESSSSPAVGSHKLHIDQQTKLVKEAINI